MYNHINIELLIKIVAWFLKTYEHDKMEETRLNRIIDELQKQKYELVFDGENLKLLKESIRWAEGIDSDHSIDHNDIQQIKQTLDSIT